MVSNPGVWAGILVALQLSATGVGLTTLSKAQRTLEFGIRWTVVLVMAVITGVLLFVNASPVFVIGAQVILAFACGVRNTMQKYDPLRGKFNFAFGLMYFCAACALGVVAVLLL